MLVLSRRPQEKIAFPGLGISVEIVRVDGRTVRVGIDAPPSVPVVRSELNPEERERFLGTPPEPTAVRLDHDLRGRLNTATMALYVAQKQVEAGEPELAQKTIQDALDAFDALEQELHSRAESAPNAGRRLNALLVEDNVNESALLVSYLRLNGFNVEAVSDGQAALDYLATRDRPNVVLLDMRLPTRSGPEILESIRGNPSHHDLKVFAVTGASSTDYDIPTGPEGVDGWFSKPLNPPRMIEAIKSVVASN